MAGNPSSCITSPGYRARLRLLSDEEGVRTEEGGHRATRRPIWTMKTGSRNQVGEIDAAEAPNTGVVLLQCGIERCCRCDEQEPKIRGRRPGDLERVMIGRRETLA